MKIPSVFRRLFAEGAFNQAFIPVLAEYKEEDKTKVESLINNTFGALTSVMIIVTKLSIL
jgi:putative peptidoglycan lipid II flippase